MRSGTAVGRKRAGGEGGGGEKRQTREREREEGGLSYVGPSPFSR
jgi:hypothetical protein